MKKHVLFIAVLFIYILSYAQSDFWESSMRYITTAPSYLVVKVKSPSYEGDAAILNNDFISYYKTINYDSLEDFDYYVMWWEGECKLAYQDIKKGKYFIISDEDFEIKYGEPQAYYFKKIILNDSVLNISKKGIDFFIRTYFDKKGNIIPHYCQKAPYDFYTIVKIMFDAKIKTGIGCVYSDYRIQDSRFYKNKKGKLVIPPEYKNKK